MKNIIFLFTLTLCLVTRSASYIDYVSPYHPVVGNSGMVVSQNKLSIIDAIAISGDITKDGNLKVNIFHRFLVPIFEQKYDDAL